MDLFRWCSNELRGLQLFLPSHSLILLGTVRGDKITDSWMRISVQPQIFTLRYKSRIAGHGTCIKKRSETTLNFDIQFLFAWQRALTEIYELNWSDLEEIAPVTINLTLPPRTGGVLPRDLWRVTVYTDTCNSSTVSSFKRRKLKLCNSHWRRLQNWCSRASVPTIIKF